MPRDVRFYPPTQKTPAVKLGMNAATDFCYGEMFAVSRCVGRTSPKLEERRRVFPRDHGRKAVGLHF